MKIGIDIDDRMYYVFQMLIKLFKLKEEGNIIHFITLTGRDGFMEN